MQAGDALPRIHGRLASTCEYLHSPDSPLPLDPARGEQQCLQLRAQEAVSQYQGTEGNQVKEVSTVFVQC